jgi:carbonic anhydrase
MRLFETILAANARAAAGQSQPGDALSIPAADLPVAVLSCVDARLNTLLPDALGIPEAQLIWLRNAGNIITNPLSSTMRSLALACTVKGAKEIAIIGHTDCKVGKMTALELLDRLSKMGVDRQRLPENLVEYFGLFGTERQNVIRGVDFVRVSPLIGPKIPVHGLLIDIKSGRLEWVVNGYQAQEMVATGKVGELFKTAEHSLDAFAKIGNVVGEELKLPTTKIGELTQSAEDWLKKTEQIAGTVQQALGVKTSAQAAVPPPPPVVLPAPLKKVLTPSKKAPPSAVPPPIQRR